MNNIYKKTRKMKVNMKKIKMQTNFVQCLVNATFFENKINL